MNEWTDGWLDGWMDFRGKNEQCRENTGSKSPFIVSHLKGSTPLSVAPGSLGRERGFLQFLQLSLNKVKFGVLLINILL